jgi:iron-sulfur cluster assembly accessory protein
MLTITAKAAEKLRESLEHEGKADYGLRVVAQAGDCSCCEPSYALLPEKEGRPEDTVITEGGLQLFIDPASLNLLEGATIDYIEHPEHGAGFLIQTPNVETEPQEQGGECCGGGGSGCGCDT